MGDEELAFHDKKGKCLNQTKKVMKKKNNNKALGAIPSTAQLKPLYQVEKLSEMACQPRRIQGLKCTTQE